MTEVEYNAYSRTGGKTLDHKERWPRMRFLIIALAVITSGCAPSQLDAFYNRSVVEDRWGKSGAHTMTVTADRRLVILYNDKIISEPSPDTFAQVASALKYVGTLSAEVSGLSGAPAGNAKGSAAFELVDRFARNAALLGVRSQGLSLFRDGTYRLAEAYMNGVVQPEGYAKLYGKLLKIADELIRFELDKNPDLASDIPKNMAEIFTSTFGEGTKEPEPNGDEENGEGTTTQPQPNETKTEPDG